MSRTQQVLKSILPRRWAEAMEAESRAWMARCEECRQERSIWDLGGIRWLAAGNPRRRLGCPHCARTTWHMIQRRTA